MKNLILLTIYTCILCITGLAQNDKEGEKSKKGSGKITAEEVINKHLASIATPEALAGVKSRVMVGTGTLTSKVGYSGQLSGPAQFASDGEKVMLAMIFKSNDYPYEKFAFDGENLTIGRPPVAQSQLGEFLKSQSSIVKQGLVGGVLSSAWPLFNFNSKKAKLEYSGIVKMDNRQFHKLKYIANRVGSLKVTLFFDSENFRHVMTEYNYTVPAPLGVNIIENSQQRPSYFTLIERFSDFKTAGQLTIPMMYTISVEAQNKDETTALQWTIKIGQVYFNEPLETTVFKVS